MEIQKQERIMDVSASPKPAFMAEASPEDNARLTTALTKLNAEHTRFKAFAKILRAQKISLRQRWELKTTEWAVEKSMKPENVLPVDFCAGSAQPVAEKMQLLTRHVEDLIRSTIDINRDVLNQSRDLTVKVFAKKKAEFVIGSIFAGAAGALGYKEGLASIERQRDERMKGLDSLRSELFEAFVATPPPRRTPAAAAPAA
jgi:hypothetical protein